MGIFLGQTNEWVAWQWVNAKTNKENIALFKPTINILKEDMETTTRSCLHMPWISVNNMQVWKNQFQNISSQAY
jgi:hypothetical protein